MAKKEELLKAIVSVEDKASKQFDKITKSMNKQNNELLRLKASMEKVRAQSRKKNDFQFSTTKAVSESNRLERAFKLLQSSASKARVAIEKVGNITSNMVPSGQTLLGGAIAGAYFGKQAFDNTFLNAAKFEMSAKTIQAMFNDQKKSQEYMSAMEKVAIDSPLFNSQDIFQNSKSFIALTKEQKTLEKMWDLSERLLAVDPTQGIEGSVFALRELFSGDAISMARRFEMPKKELNDIAKMPLDKQIKALDKLFNKMGMTKHLVDEMGDTTLGVWNQILETVNVANRKIGEPAVKIIKPFLDDINNALQSGKGNKYVEFGQQMASGIATGFVNGARGLGSWVDGIMNDPKFQKLTSVEAKVGFVFEDISQRFNEWLNSGGNEKIQQTADKLIQTLVKGIENSIELITPIATKIGISIGQGVLSGFNSAIQDSWMLQILSGSSSGKNDFIVDQGVKWTGKVVSNLLGGNKSSSSNKSSSTPKPSYAPTVTLPRATGHKKHAFGIQRVPRDNYPTILHEGESVKTKQETNQNKINGGEPSVLITGNYFTVREEADIQKIAKEFVREWKKERLNVGGVHQ
ncbi:hypothetical protein [Bacillus sp. AFS040349]|uniref:hypothetical protein n=1 Tax=Bacillus sp. AFS040349 TaxID=2033502 RepID=UPI000BFBDFFF|nr:hypothetical protein [Bacillus sp. AFS040349]PGT89217.1 hypothetical protein COD11_04255 [Bacillus sp. AFS040349]